MNLDHWRHWSMSTKRTALITGYTGETGRKLLDQLLRKDEIKKIILVGRQTVEFTDELYKEKTVILWSKHNQK